MSVMGLVRAAERCRGEDPRLFLEPDMGTEGYEPPDVDYSTAVDICSKCSLRFPCVRDAVKDQEVSGVRGGFTPIEIRDLWAKHPEKIKQHGVVSGYNTAKCRCPDCRANMTEYQAEVRVKKGHAPVRRDGEEKEIKPELLQAALERLVEQYRSRYPDEDLSPFLGGASEAGLDQLGDFAFAEGMGDALMEALGSVKRTVLPPLVDFHRPWWVGQVEGLDS